jgi:hypothetical protein
VEEEMLPIATIILLTAAMVALVAVWVGLPKLVPIVLPLHPKLVKSAIYFSNRILSLVHLLNCLYPTDQYPILVVAVMAHHSANMAFDRLLVSVCSKYKTYSVPTLYFLGIVSKHSSFQA